MVKSTSLILLITFSISSALPNPLKDQQPSTVGNGEDVDVKLKTSVLDDDDTPPATTYRLPNDTRPVRYDLWLKTDVDKAEFGFEGRVKIHVRAVEATGSVTLHYRDTIVNDVNLISLTGEVLNESLVFERVEPEEYELLRITLPSAVDASEEFIIEISYRGELNDYDGFYKAYYTANEEDIYYAVTQFGSTYARHAFPCYDEIGIRAPIGLELQHDKGYSAFSNMPLADTIAIPDSDYVISKFDDTPPMQAYLLAFLISPFTSVPNNDTEIPQKIIAQSSSILAGEADYAASICDAILKRFVSHFGVYFPMAKLDHAAIPQFAIRSMENWGLSTYRTSSLLIDKSYTDAEMKAYKRHIAEVIAHEIAHQFTGNLVSPAWWTDLWLSEGFATLYEYSIPHLLWPEDGHDEEFRSYRLDFALAHDLSTVSYYNSKPMSFYVESPADINERFNFISYGKAAAVLGMFQELLTVETFTRGVGKYLTKMSFKAAVPADLFSALQDAYKEDNPNGDLSIESVMSGWVYQAGFPLVSVEKSGSSIILRQTGFPTGTQKFAIPLSFATRTSPDFSRTSDVIWLLNGTMEIPQATFGISDDDWIIFNLQQTGFYRMSYDAGLWLAIAGGLRENHSAIHRLNRRYLQQELNIGYSTLNSLLASEVLEFERYLASEDDYLVWNEASTIVRALNATLFGTAIHGSYLNFIKSITKPLLDRIGFENDDDDGEADSVTQLRAQIKALDCYSMDADCLHFEHQKLLNYMQDDANAIPDFCSAFRHANESIYSHFLVEIAENSQLNNRFSIITGIACSLDTDLLALAIAVVEDEDNTLSYYERTLLIRHMLTTSDVGFEVAFEYLLGHLATISAFTSELSWTVNTRDYANKLYKMLDDALTQELLWDADVIDAVMNQVYANLVWHEKHYTALSEWFELNADTTTTTTTTQAANGDTTTNDEFTDETTETTTPDSGHLNFASILTLIIPFAVIALLF
jgi:aminopeptidase N